MDPSPSMLLVPYVMQGLSILYVCMLELLKGLAFEWNSVSPEDPHEIHTICKAKPPASGNLLHLPSNDAMEVHCNPPYQCGHQHQLSLCDKVESTNLQYKNPGYDMM